MRPERIEVICVHDPAIDTKSMTVEQMMEYAKTRDQKVLRMVPGVAPTVFHCREVPQALWTSYIMGGGTEAELLERCFLAGVERVENLFGRDGVCIPDWQPPRDSEDRMQRESLKRFAPAEVLEVGQAIWQHSFLPPRIAPTYRLPHTCLAALMGREFRPADASPSERDPNSAPVSHASASHPPQQTETDPDKPPHADSSGSPTDATAAAP